MSGPSVSPKVSVTRMLSFCSYHMQMCRQSRSRANGTCPHRVGM